MADGRGDGALLQAETLNETICMVAVLAMALDDGDLDHVVFQIDGCLVARGRQTVTAVLGDDLAGHHADDGRFTLGDGHAEIGGLDHPRPDAVLAKELLGLHANVVRKNQDKKAIAIERFNEGAWNDLNGAPAPTDAPVSQDVASAAVDQFEGLEDLTPAAPAAPANEGGFDLGDLDDVLG